MHLGISRIPLVVVKSPPPAQNGGKLLAVSLVDAPTVYAADAAKRDTSLMQLSLSGKLGRSLAWCVLV